jgi:fatty-acyl-CoA synthase
MVGDAFARPMLTELKARGRTEELRSLEIMISAGSVWSRDARAQLIELLPWITLSDNYGSSEALRGVQTYSRTGEVPRTGVIASSELLRMVDEQDRFLDITTPGTRGMLALTGHLADGYYKDPERSASTWKVIDGVRCCLTGDYGSVEPDGTIRLLGRGSSVINTGGEKVYPQEVEGVLRSHPTVDDAAVIGVPNERFGQAIAALVVPARDGEVALDELSRHVKEHLAGYKAPRHLVLVDAIPRNATGKIDYARSHALAQQAERNP